MQKHTHEIILISEYSSMASINIYIYILRQAEETTSDTLRLPLVLGITFRIPHGPGMLTVTYSEAKALPINHYINFPELRFACSVAGKNKNIPQMVGGFSWWFTMVEFVKHHQKKQTQGKWCNTWWTIQANEKASSTKPVWQVWRYPLAN